jgi:hypothetical protein
MRVFLGRPEIVRNFISYKNAFYKSSHNNCKDVVMAIKSSLPVWTDVENLRKFELITVVHHQAS